MRQVVVIICCALVITSCATQTHAPIPSDSARPSSTKPSAPKASKELPTGDKATTFPSQELLSNRSPDSPSNSTEAHLASRPSAQSKSPQHTNDETGRASEPNLTVQDNEPKLFAKLSQEKIGNLAEEARSNIKQAEESLDKIDPQHLTKAQRDVLLTCESFVSKAKDSLARSEFLIATNFASKAQKLAADLASSSGSR